MWTPDVYEGSPTPVTAFMSSATKAAGFAALLRVLLTAFDGYRTDWRPAIWALAILTLLLGSIVALVQTDIKRMLAYSSISHAGYILIGVEAGTRQGLRAALFYLFVYTFMTIGSFAIVAVIGRRDDRHIISDYRGLATRQPLLAGLFAFFLLAQAGIPPTGGFIAKLGVFSSVANSPVASRPARAVLLAADRRRDRLGDLGLLLPPGHHHDVLARRRDAPEGEVAAAGPGAGDQHRHPDRGGAGRVRGAHPLGRDPAVADPRLRPRRHPDLLGAGMPKCRPVRRRPATLSGAAFPVCRFAKARTYTRPDQPHSWWRGLA